MFGAPLKNARREMATEIEVLMPRPCVYRQVFCVACGFLNYTRPGPQGFVRDGKNLLSHG